MGTNTEMSTKGSTEGSMRRNTGISWERRLAGTLAVALACVCAGCGSGSSTGTGADPASAIPSSAPVYVGAVVRPSGSLQSDALAVGHKLTGQANPYMSLVGLLRTPGAPPLDYKRDIAPWLGPNAGLFLTSLGSGEALTSLLQQGLTGGAAAGAKWPFGGGGGGNGGEAGAGATGGSGSTASGSGSTASAGGAQGAFVLDTSSLQAARTFVANAAAHAGAHASSYRGVAYQVTSGGDAFAVVDRFVVLGTEAGVHAVIDTTQGGASLKDDATYAQLQSVAPAGVLGHVYANPSALSATAHAAAGTRSGQSAGSPSGAGQGSGEGSGGGEGPGAGNRSARSLPALLSVLGGTRPLNVSLVPASSSLALDADAGPPPAGVPRTQNGGLIAATATGSRAFGELPGESWLAAGFGNVNGALGGSLSGLHELLALASTLGSSGAGEGASSPQAGLSVKGLLEGLAKPLEALTANTAQARRDYLSWMGEAGTFVSGTTVLELKGAVVIDSTDAAASRAAVTKLASALDQAGGEATPVSIPGAEAAIEAKITGLPVTLVIADGRTASGQAKFVLGLGESSIKAALSPSGTMASAPAYSAAQSALGEGIKPSITVAFASLLSLLEGVGLSEDPAVSKLVPYMRASSTLAGGGKELSGGVQRLKLVLGLQPGTG